MERSDTERLADELLYRFGPGVRVEFKSRVYHATQLFPEPE